MSKEPYQVVPIPRQRRFALDAGRLRGGKHTVHGLAEVDVTLGGIAKKPGVVDDQITVREYLHLTISVDHDVVDGAPIARFGNELMTLIEQGYGLL